MAISIVDHELSDETHNIYDVNFYEDQIHTMVTHTPGCVTTWISEIKNIHRRRLHNLVVGLDVEWRPSFNRNIENPVATLQLCVGRRCLIFQLIYAPLVPDSLLNFLTNPNFTFVGVGIESDVEKLKDDYNLEVSNVVDIRELAANAYEIRELRNAGLKNLAMQVLGKEIMKPKRITLSRWDNEWLTPAQVQYACIDAFISFEIGRILNAADTRSSLGSSGRRVF